jgi:hypothetical protein
MHEYRKDRREQSDEKSNTHGKAQSPVQLLSVRLLAFRPVCGVHRLGHR